MWKSFPGGNVCYILNHLSIEMKKKNKQTNLVAQMGSRDKLNWSTRPLGAQPCPFPDTCHREALFFPPAEEQGCLTPASLGTALSLPFRYPEW